jgi:transcriptional regulator with XRE-family HTH domain
MFSGHDTKGYRMLLLVKLRKKKGWSQAALSRASLMSASTVCAIEGGHMNAYPAQRIKIARALDWPEERAAELFEEVDDGERD